MAKRGNNNITRQSTDAYVWWANVGDILNPQKMLEIRDRQNNDITSTATFTITTQNPPGIISEDNVILGNGYIEITPAVYGGQTLDPVAYSIRIKVQGIGYKEFATQNTYSLATGDQVINITAPEKNSDNESYKLYFIDSPTGNDLGPIFKLYPENNYFSVNSIQLSGTDFFKAKINGVESSYFDVQNGTGATVSVSVNIEKWGDIVDFTQAPGSYSKQITPLVDQKTFNIKIVAYASGGFNIDSNEIGVYSTEQITPLDLVEVSSESSEKHLYNPPEPQNKNYTLWVHNPESPTHNFPSDFIENGDNGIVKVIQNDNFYGWEFYEGVYDITYIAIQNAVEDPFTGIKPFAIKPIRYAYLPEKIIFKINDIETDEAVLYSSVYKWKGYTISQYPEGTEELGNFTYRVLRDPDQPDVDPPIEVDEDGMITLTDTQHPGTYILRVSGTTEVSENTPIIADLKIKVMLASL